MTSVFIYPSVVKNSQTKVVDGVERLPCAIGMFKKKKAVGICMRPKQSRNSLPPASCDPI